MSYTGTSYVPCDADPRFTDGDDLRKEESIDLSHFARLERVYGCGTRSGCRSMTRGVFPADDQNGDGQRLG